MTIKIRRGGKVLKKRKNGFIEEMSYSEITDAEGRLCYSDNDRGIFLEFILPAILILGFAMGIVEWFSIFLFSFLWQ